jgi:tetratricopeptide (TPR) repeat protein
MSNHAAVEKLKDQGNEAMKSSVERAIELYTQALALDATHVATLTNRAQAYLKTGKFAECVDDCTAALKVDSSNAKALFRRASAYKELRRPEAAIADLSKLLTIDPANSVAREQLNQLKWTAKSVARSERLAPKVPTPAATAERATVLSSSSVDDAVDVVMQAPPVIKAAQPTPAPVATVTPSRKAPQFQIVPSGDVDRILSRAAPTNSAQYEALVAELFATALERTDKLSRLFSFLRVPQLDLSKLFTAELDESTLSTTLEAVSANAAPTTDAAFCKAFLEALYKMPRFDLVSMCIDDISQQRIDNIRKLCL